MVRRIGVPENRQNARNPPPLSSTLFAYILEYKRVVIMWHRTGVSDMAMDLDESRCERSGVPTRRLFPCLEPGAWQWRVSYKGQTCL